MGKLGREGAVHGQGCRWIFMLPFFIEVNLGFCFCCVRSAHKCPNGLIVLILLMLLSLRLASRLQIQNVNPEPTHFIGPPPLSATHVPKERTHKKVSLAYVTNIMCVWVRVYYERSLEGRKKINKDDDKC